MATIKQPWAILLCKFNSDFTGKANTNAEPPNAPGVVPLRTACENFFTKTNAGYNAVRYFSDMSHQTVDISDSRVFGWYTIGVNITDYTPAGDPKLDKTQGEVVDLAKQAAINAGVNLNSFFGIVVIMNIATGWAQGWPGHVAADWRRVDGRNMNGTLGNRSAGGGNGVEVFGQEMGHGWGLDHSRHLGSNADYQDKYDIMSTLNAFSSADADYCAKGPGLNAWNMRSRGWLDESRVWQCPNGYFFDVIQLRPLHRTDLPGYLAAEVPPVNSTDGFPAYLVEYRKKERWDIGFPSSCVLIHSYQGHINQQLGGHTYLMNGTNGQTNLLAGDSFAPTLFGGSHVHVIDIDDANSTATILITKTEFRFPATFDPGWWITTRKGLVAPGPPPPWLQHYLAVSTLLETASNVSAELRTSVLKIAMQQISLITKDIKKEIKNDKNK
ncbi:MAG TPA: hypothetical protein VK492_07625 [Chitinophagaceae bacterium]|nr:hypothetical protein [Chitinophagaceae bacterium]